MDYDALERAAQAADHHAQTCRCCGVPIIDDSGNPGLYGEACAVGLRLLADYEDAAGSIVPTWVRKALEVSP